MVLEGRSLRGAPERIGAVVLVVADGKKSRCTFGSESGRCVVAEPAPPRRRILPLRRRRSLPLPLEPSAPQPLFIGR